VGRRREIIGLLVRTSREAGGARAQGFALEGNRRQFQQRKASEQQLRQAESTSSPRASNWRPSMRAREARQVVASLAAAEARAQRPALQAAYGRRGALAGRARPLRTDREGGRRRIPGISVEASAPSTSRPSPAPRCLCLRLARTNLVGRARRAMSKREATEYYGDLPPAFHHERHREGAEPAQAARGITQEVAQRSERIAVDAAYLGEFETVPIPESCAVSRATCCARLAGRDGGEAAERRSPKTPGTCSRSCCAEHGAVAGALRFSAARCASARDAPGDARHHVGHDLGRLVEHGVRKFRVRQFFVA
jgi:hypothetical protein